MKIQVPDPNQEYDHLGQPVDGPARFVETETYEPRRPRQNGTPPRLSEIEIRALHRAYVAGATVPELALRFHQRYASVRCAEVALHKLFHARGLPMRSTTEANRLRGEKLRGPGVPHSREDQAGYRRARRRSPQAKTPKRSVLA